MGLPATIHQFLLELSDSDRGVFRPIELRVARHPSETAEFLVTRVLAYALEATEGLELGPGLSTPDEPALSIRDATGARRAWIEVGSPDARRLHRAAKASPRVVVYPVRDPAPWLRELAGERIHRADELEIRRLPPAVVAGLVARLERRTAFSLAVTDGQLYASVGAESFDGTVERLSIP